jgi:hypothetical protein
MKNVDGQILESMILAVEIKNVYNEKDGDIDLDVLETSLLSRQWKLTDITTAGNAVGLLTSHERLHLILKARRIFENLPEGKVEHTCLKVNPNYSENNDFTKYYTFYSDFKPSIIDNPDLLNQNNQANRQGLIQSMLVVRWKASNAQNGRSAIGQHCMWLDCFTKTVSHLKEPIPSEIPTLQLEDNEFKTDLDSTQKTRKDNVIFRLEHTDVIKHNFNERRLCLVPITINIVNCYEVPVKVFIDMAKQQNR